MSTTDTAGMFVIGAILGFELGVIVEMRNVQDSVCYKQDPSCRIIRCERIVDENGKKTCERWGE